MELQRGLTPASAAATIPSSDTMLFTSISDDSTSAAASGFSFGLPTSSAGPLDGRTFGFAFNFPGANGEASAAYTTTSTTSATTITTTTTTTVTSGFIFNLQQLASPGIDGIVPVNFTSVPSTSTVNSIQTPVMTYGQLESLINKWYLEAEDEEKHFVQQANQVNAWDRALIENSEKIMSLHAEVENMKLHQKRLEQELDFILSQQKELEDLLILLEESVKDQSGSVCLPQADEDRMRIYKFAENIDAQLKFIAQDLNNILECLNRFAIPADTSDPLQQICKILNAHMAFLEKIDQNSGLLQRKVDEIAQVFKDQYRKDQEPKGAFD